MDALNTEFYRQQNAVLAKTVYDLTWAGTYWGAQGAVRLSRLRWNNALKHLDATETDAWSSLSSTYYSASGNALARSKKAIWTKPLWLILSLLCYAKALSLSQKVFKKLDYERMTPDQLDVRSSILRAWPFPVLRRFMAKASRECITEALDRRPEPSRESKILLIKGRAECEIMLGQKVRAENAFHDAMQIVYHPDVSPGARVRVKRSYARFLSGLKDREQESSKLYQEASIEARTAGLEDQVLKIQESNKFRIS